MKKIATMIALLCAAGFAQEKGSFKDARDGKTYKTVKIGTQTWMAENLNYNAKGSVCYGNKPANCTKYGRLYYWKAAMEACPSGWHLPSLDEWQTLVDFAGGNEAAGKKLKAKSGWNSHEGKSGNGTDAYGFAALPSGAACSDGYFSAGQIGAVGEIGDIWAAWDEGAYYGFGLFNAGHGHALMCTGQAESVFPVLLGVRCVQGSVEEAKAEFEKKAEAEKAKLFNPKIKYGSMTDARDKTTYKTVKIGPQTWMAENLNYNAKDSECSRYNPSNCAKYGRLYYWKTAMKACPSGWHLPSKKEWEILVDFAGGNEVAGEKLKAAAGGWTDYEGKSSNGTDDYGFSALPGGYAHSYEGFIDVGYGGNWWSTAENEIQMSSGTYIRFEDCPGCTEESSYSIRCVMD